MAFSVPWFTFFRETRVSQSRGTPVICPLSFVYSPLFFCFFFLSPSLWLPLSRLRAPLEKLLLFYAISFSWRLNHPRVCRAWRPVSLERRVLVIEALSDQHIALASASGKREVCCGPQHINRLKWLVGWLVGAV